MFTEIGTAQKAGETRQGGSPENNAAQDVVTTKIGVALTGGKLLEIPCACLTKVGSLTEGDRIAQLQCILLRHLERISDFPDGQS